MDSRKDVSDNRSMNKARMIFSVLVLSLLFSCSMPHHGTEGGSGLLPLQLTEMHDGMNSLFKPVSTLLYSRFRKRPAIMASEKQKEAGLYLRKLIMVISALMATAFQ